MCRCGYKGADSIFKFVQQKVVHGVELRLQNLGMSVEVFLKPNEAFSERNIDIDRATVVVLALHSMEPIIEQRGGFEGDVVICEGAFQAMMDTAISLGANARLLIEHRLQLTLEA